MAKKNALGRGLGALIENHEENKSGHKEKLHTDVVDDPTNTVREVALEEIEVNPYQPRSVFDEVALNELAESIKELGIIQPISVRKLNDKKYQLITGERRLRAAKIAGLGQIPAYIREANDQSMIEMALVENIQREDLDAIEIALSYQRLIEECDLTQEVVSSRVGKNRATVSNYLRLLKLPPLIQKGIQEGSLSMGHARTIITVEDPEIQLEAFKKIISDELSVRKTEELVRKLKDRKEHPPQPKEPQTEHTKEYEDLKSHLTDFFNTKIEFKRSNNGTGKIVIPFKSDEDLERIMGILDR
ncbi:MAG: ParB/RepB/Spo0J family partition protein [Bacteroidota bacterium]